MSCFNLNIKKRRAGNIYKDGNIVNGIVKANTLNSKSQVVHTYTNENSQFNSRHGIIKDGSCSMLSVGCVEEKGCGPPCTTNNIEIRDICYNEWSTKFDHGNILKNYPDIYIHDGMLSGQLLGKLTDLIITGNRGCIELGRDCCGAFFNTQKNIYDGKINILLIIQPGLTNIGNTTYDESTIRLTIGSTTIPHSSGIGYTISNNFVIKSGVSNRGKPYVNPIAGYRKTLNCCSGNKHIERVYKDSIALWTHKVGLDRCVIYDTRIRSGMQPKSKCNIASDYSFSYAQYNKNRNMNTYDRGLEIYKTIDNNELKRGLNKDCPCYLKRKGINCNNCSSTNKECTINKQQTSTIWKPNNNKFKVQGAVSAGSRLERLKLDTIKVANSNPNGKFSCKELCDSNKVGKGPYFAGKPRFDGWIYNSKHPEVVNNNTYKQTPFGIPQLLGNHRSTRSIKTNNYTRENKDIRIVTQRKNKCC